MRLRLKIYWLVLLILTVMIPLRRGLWEQVPTQVGGFWVWSTIGFNLALLVYLWRRSGERPAIIQEKGSS